MGGREEGERKMGPVQIWKGIEKKYRYQEFENTWVAGRERELWVAILHM